MGQGPMGTGQMMAGGQLAPAHMASAYMAPGQLVPAQMMPPAPMMGAMMPAMPQVGGPPSPEAVRGGGSPISVAMVLYVLRKRWKLSLLLGSVLSVIVASFIWSGFKQTYRAEAWIKIQAEVEEIIGKLPPAKAGNFVQTQIELIRSPLVLGQVLMTPEVAKLKSVQKKSDPKSWLRSNLKIGRVGGSELFRVEFVSKSPETAKTIVDAIVEEYLAVQTNQAEVQTHKILKLLETERARQKAEVLRLDKRIQDLSRVRANKSSAVTAGPDGSLDVTLGPQVNMLRTELINLRINKKMLRLNMETMPDLDPDAQLTDLTLERAVQQQPRVIELRSKINARYQYLESQSERPTWRKGTKQHEDFAKRTEELENELVELRKDVAEQIAKEAKVNMENVYDDRKAKMQSTLHEMELREEQLINALAEEQKKVQEQSDLEHEIASLNGELSRAREVETAISSRIFWMRVERLPQERPSQVQLLQAAELPTEPQEEWPMSKILMGSGAVFFLPLLCFGALEFLVRRVYDAKNLEAHTQLPTIAEVTTIPTQPLVPSFGGTKRYELQQAMFNESIEVLRSALQVADEVGSRQVLMVASSVKGEGKTSLASYLSVSWSRGANETVLIIDADIRSPDVHNRFDLEKQPGLSDVLTGKVDLDDAIVHWDDRLYVLPAGELEGSAPELLTRRRFADLLDRLREKFQRIIVDTPPVLAAAEALHVAKAVDGVVFVSRSEYTRADQIKRACRRLAHAGIFPLGAVLNGTRCSTYSFSYGSYYGSYGGYAVYGDGPGSPEEEVEEFLDEPSSLDAYEDEQAESSAVLDAETSVSSMGGYLHTTTFDHPLPFELQESTFPEDLRPKSSRSKSSRKPNRSEGHDHLHNTTAEHTKPRELVNAVYPEDLAPSPTASVAAQPVAHQPVAHQPVAHQPVAHQPAVEQSGLQQRRVQENVADDVCDVHYEEDIHEATGATTYEQAMPEELLHATFPEDPGSDHLGQTSFEEAKPPELQEAAEAEGPDAPESEGAQPSYDNPTHSQSTGSDAGQSTVATTDAVHLSQPEKQDLKEEFPDLGSDADWDDFADDEDQSSLDISFNDFWSSLRQRPTGKHLKGGSQDPNGSQDDPAS